MGIIRNHYVGRTFIQPTQGERELSVRMKLAPNRAVLAGKKPASSLTQANEQVNALFK